MNFFSCEKFNEQFELFQTMDWKMDWKVDQTVGRNKINDAIESPPLSQVG